MSLIQSARMNGHDPYAYLKDVLTRLPTHKASRIEELLPHRQLGTFAKQQSSLVAMEACHSGHLLGTRDRVVGP